jgi:hypothetical protein
MINKLCRSDPDSGPDSDCGLRLNLKHDAYPESVVETISGISVFTITPAPIDCVGSSDG